MQLVQLGRSTGKQATGRSRKLLLLIDPYPEDNPYRINEKEQAAIWFPKLSLPVIASRTPKTWDIRLVDEGRTIVTPSLIDEVIKERGAENIFVGISTQMTCYTPRAYEIADRFRARGVRVSLGGTHATYMPEEAKEHADVVVKFEADELWPEVIRDFETGKLKPFYEMSSYPTLENYPHPRVDLLPQGSYMTNQCVQTTRGCHFECEFCSVSPFNGKSSRRRPVDEVIAEIQRVKEWRRSQLVDKMVRGPIWHRIGTSLRIMTGIEDGTIFAFVDDLHNSNRDYCKKLWTALKELNIKWGAQCTLFLGNEPDMVKLAADSGCVAMFVGMESINGDVLAEMNKPFNQEKKFAEQIQCFHDHGIMVNPGIIFGSDQDDESVFENTIEFLIKCRVELAYINIATPLPGTVLFDRMRAENRIFDWDWSHYDGKHVVFRPKRMSVDALEEGFAWANRQFFSYPSIFTRLSATKQRLAARWVMNWRFRQLVQRTCPKGTLSPMAKILKDLSGRLPSYETKDLVPNALHALKEKAEEVSKYLEVKVRKNETLSGLMINLEGTLDQLNAKELKKRMIQAAKQAKIDIVLNFEHLQHTTPAALATLADPNFLKNMAAAANMKFMNLKKSFQQAVDPILLSLDMGEEIGQR
ncbi:MAG TPA: radical SAM protein [Candidatus Manganitrophaceae bacterium]|nr:radical SAM protein [Candidatus Manganitrophaceae bacterium]